MKRLGILYCCATDGRYHPVFGNHIATYLDFLCTNVFPF